MKRCSKCGFDKDEATEFHKDSRTGRPRSWCKVCVNRDNVARQAAKPAEATARVKAWRKANPEKFAAQIKDWREANPDRYHQTIIRNKYGGLDWQALWDAQQGLCACCGQPMKPRGRDKDSACVDHDRTCCPGRTSCGKCVRGVIHWACNLMLGYAADNPEILRAGVAYLERNRRPLRLRFPLGRGGCRSFDRAPDTSVGPGRLMPPSGRDQMSHLTTERV